MSRRTAQRVSISNTAVRVLYNVVEKKQKLESAWLSETSRLPLADQKVLRDVCSGTLRRLDYYSRVIDWAAKPKAADNTHFRLLAATTLYQIEHMKHTPGWDSLSAAASECCDQLIAQKQNKPWATRALKELLQDVPEMSLTDSERAHTKASALSLPPWLYDRLESTSPVRKYARILLERPDFLCLYVPPSAYATRDEYIAKLRGFDPSLKASASELAPHAVVIRPRPRDVGELPGVRERSVHVQDLAQQYGASLLRPLQPGDRILDSTAAPGGKSFAVLHEQPHARLVAIDHNPKKAAALREKLCALPLLHRGGAGGDAAGGDVIGGEAIGGPIGAAKWVQEWMSHAPVQEQQLAAADADASEQQSAAAAKQAVQDGNEADSEAVLTSKQAFLLTGKRPRRQRTRVKVLCADAAEPSRWWDGEPFAAILLDPPCTSTGLVRTLPEVKAHRTAEDITVLREMQLRLLRGVWPTLAEGGELLYTTCSLLDDENCDVVRDFLRETPDATTAILRRPGGGAGNKGGGGGGDGGGGGGGGGGDGFELTSLTAHKPYGGVTFYPSPTHQGGFVSLLRKAAVGSAPIRPTGIDGARSGARRPHSRQTKAKGKRGPKRKRSRTAS